MFQALCGGEMAWVTRDWTAHTQAELSLKQGQQVELLDVWQDVAAPQLVRVRLELTEGLVPSSCLQMPPRGGQLSEGRQLHSVITGDINSKSLTFLRNECNYKINAMAKCWNFVDPRCNTEICIAQ